MRVGVNAHRIIAAGGKLIQAPGPSPHTRHRASGARARKSPTSQWQAAVRYDASRQPSFLMARQPGDPSQLRDPGGRRADFLRAGLGARKEHIALTCVAREGGRALELRSGLFESFQLEEKVSAERPAGGGMSRAKVPKSAYPRPRGLPRDRKPWPGRRRDSAGRSATAWAGKRVVQCRHPDPVRLRCRARTGVTGGNGGLEPVRAMCTVRPQAARPRATRPRWMRSWSHRARSWSSSSTASPGRAHARLSIATPVTPSGPPGRELPVPAEQARQGCGPDEAHPRRGRAASSHPPAWPSSLR